MNKPNKTIKQTTSIALKILDEIAQIMPMKKCPICKGKLVEKMNFYTCQKCHNDFFTMSIGKHKGEIYIWNPPEAEWELFKKHEKVTFT